MAGLSRRLYWTVNFLADLAYFLVPALLILLVFKLFGISVFVHDLSVLGSLLLAMLLFAWAAIPLVYVLSFAFDSAPKGYTLIVVYNIISGGWSAGF